MKTKTNQKSPSERRQAAEVRRRARREREREARVESICAAACRLFAARGVAATSMEEVADEAALGKATLYHYFPTKQALYAEIVRRAAAELAAAGGRVDPGGGVAAAVDALEGFARAYFADQGTLPRVMLPLMAGGRAAVEAELGSEVAREVARAHAPVYRALTVVEDALGQPGVVRDLLTTVLVGLALRCQRNPDLKPGPELDPFFFLLRRACGLAEEPLDP